MGLFSRKRNQRNNHGGGHIHPPGHFCGSNCPMYKKPPTRWNVQPLQKLTFEDPVRVFMTRGAVEAVQLQRGARYRLLDNGALYNEHGTQLGQFSKPDVPSEGPKPSMSADLSDWVVQIWFDEGEGYDDEPGGARIVQAKDREEAIRLYTEGVMGADWTPGGGDWYDCKPLAEWLERGHYRPERLEGSDA